MTLYLSILTQTLTMVVAVRGAYVFTGLTGMFSLGQAAFMAVGSCALGVLMVKCGFPFWLARILTVLIAAVIDYLVGFPAVRLRRDYIPLATLGFGEATTVLLSRATKPTGGVSGFIGISRRTTFLLALVSAIAAIAIISWFKINKCDRQCIAVRGDEPAAKAMGISVLKIKMSAFLLNVAVTAFSGCLCAFFITCVDPTISGWKKGADWVIMIFLGGVNNLTGSVAGAFILSGLLEVLRSLDQCRNIIYTALALLTINFKPFGIFGEWGLSPRNLKVLGEKLVKRSRKEEKTDGAAWGRKY